MAAPYWLVSSATPEAQQRRQIRGCNWTLGGLFQLHTLEIEHEDGAVRPSFEIASKEEARGSGEPGLSYWSVF